MFLKKNYNKKTSGYC